MNADSLLYWLMRTSLEASILILAVLGLRWALGQRLSPAWRIGLWMLVGAKLMLPAFVPAGFGLGAWMKQEAAATVTAARSDTEAPVQTAMIAARTADLPDGGTKTTWSFSPKVALVWLWLVGTAGILLAALIRQRRFAALLRSRPPGTAPMLRALVASLAHRAGVRQAVRIVLMPAGTTPAMVGIRQPTLLLPQDWQERFDERSLRHVVAHELFHVKQGDLAWNWIALAVQAVHWFNPLVWLVVSRFQADRELRCDAGALTLLAPTERLEYGHTLLRIQETFFAPPAIAGLAPCVRNHPTLRQRILMIARPTTRQPWIQALLVLTLSVLVCYSFTTARAQEKEVPPKERTRDSSRSGTTPAQEGEDGVKKPGDREREGDGAARKPGTREGEDGAKKPGMRDGEGERKAGARDGDGERKPGMRDGERPRTGERDGEKPRSGMRDGERPRTGDRDRERPRSGERDGEKPRTGERDGEKPRTGERDGERSRTETRDGEGAARTGTREGASTSGSSAETITLRVVKNGEAVMVGEEEVAMNRLRGHLNSFLPDHPGAKIVVTGDSDVPVGALHNTVDAVRDNGNKNVGIKSE